MKSKQLLGLIGSIVLFVGVFAPIVSVPIMGNMNYFQNGKGDGIIVIFLAIVSLVLVLAKQFRGLWLTGFGSLAVMAFTFINFQTKMSEVRSQMETDLAGNPFRGLADMAMQSVQLQWGWALLVVGAALVIASALMKEDYTIPVKGIPVAFGQTVQEHFKTARSLYKEKKYDQAIPHFEKVVEILKKNNNLPVAQKVQIKLANIYLIQGKYDLALKELETGKDLYGKPEEKTKINLYSKLATANHKLKHYAGAAQILEQLLASGVTLTPAQKANLQATLADAYRRNEIYSKALQA